MDFYMQDILFYNEKWYQYSTCYTESEYQQDSSFHFHLFIFFIFLDVKISGDNMAMQTVKYRQDKTKQN